MPRCRRAGEQANLEATPPRESPGRVPPSFRPDTAGSLSVNYLAAAACCLFGAILVALGLQWEPIGTRKAGRVMIVEKHSPWSPSDFPYNTEVLGGGPDENELQPTTMRPLTSTSASTTKCRG